MKITAIRCFPVWVGIRNQLLVKVETDEGIFGWGESGLSGREKAVIGAIEHFAEFAVGRDPMRIGALWQEMYRGQYFEGGRVLSAAISAIDIALHDIKGKALGVPVCWGCGRMRAGGRPLGPGSLRPQTGSVPARSVVPNLHSCTRPFQPDLAPQG